MKKSYYVTLSFLLVLLVLLFNTVNFAQDTLGIYRDKDSNILEIQKNNITGSPHRIFGINRNLKSYGFNINTLNKDKFKDITKNVLNDFADIIKISPDQLIERKIESVEQLWFVDYIQVYNNIPVYNSEFGYTIDKNGNIISLGADIFYDITGFDTKPVLSKEQALKIAVNDFSITNYKIEDEISLIIVPQTNQTTNYNLCWKIKLTSNNPIKSYTYYIDSKNGSIIYFQNEMVESGNLVGNIKGGYWPQHYYDTPVTSVPFITTDINLYTVSMSLLAQTNTDANGNYSFNASTGQKTLVIPLQNTNCKVIDGGETFSPIIVDKRVKIYTIAGNPNPWIENKDWGVTDGSNVRWHISYAHDFYKNKFNFTNLDYCMEARINAGSDINGGSDGEKVFFGSQGGYYWARCSDVLYHEYTHNVINKLYGGWIGQGDDEAGAMNEGLPDYFACTINDDSNYGESVSPNNQRNLINNYSYDLSKGKYFNSQVISGACWNIRKVLGATISDNLVFRALQMSPKARNFQDFLYNLLSANIAYYNGIYVNQILTAFANHSIYPRTLSSSISGPTSLNYRQTGTWIASVTGGLPPYSYRWYYRYPCNGLSTSTFEQNNRIIPRLPGCGDWNATSVYTQTLSRYDQLSFELKCTVTDALGTSISSNILNVTVNGSVKKENIASQTKEYFEYKLYENYPNPFNPSTEIKYSIKKDGLVTLRIFDVLGREVALLINEVQTAGIYTIIFNAEEFSSGIYFYEITSTDFHQVKKMLFAK